MKKRGKFFLKIINPWMVGLYKFTGNKSFFLIKVWEGKVDIDEFNRLTDGHQPELWNN